MPSLIKPGSVNVLTQNGEVRVSITLELNINLNSDGVVASVQSHTEKVIAKEPEKTEWAIPDFESIPKINFGK